jgi:hypothetical protein
MSAFGGKADMAATLLPQRRNPPRGSKITVTLTANSRRGAPGVAGFSLAHFLARYSRLAVWPALSSESGTNMTPTGFEVFINPT